MGIRENIRELQEWIENKNMEAKLEKKVTEQSIEGTRFFNEYNSFAVGLEEELEYKLRYSETIPVGMIEYAPTEIKYARYFEQAREEPRFTRYYNIHKTTGGTYQFSKKKLDDLMSNYEKGD